MNASERVYALLTVVQSHAPNGTEQQKVADLANGVVTQFGPEQAEKVLAGMLADGLNYGNWPWVIAEALRTGRYPTPDAVGVK